MAGVPVRYGYDVMRRQAWVLAVAQYWTLPQQAQAQGVSRAWREWMQVAILEQLARSLLGITNHHGRQCDLVRRVQAAIGVANEAAVVVKDVAPLMAYLLPVPLDAPSFSRTLAAWVATHCGFCGQPCTDVASVTLVDDCMASGTSHICTTCQAESLELDPHLPWKHPACRPLYQRFWKREAPFCIFKSAANAYRPYRPPLRFVLRS